MRSAVRSSFEFLSMSTLDLFASILGTFVLITFVLLPYYLEQPFLEADIAQAQAETSALTAELRRYREKLTATRTARSEAEDALVAAQQRLAAAKALAAAQPAPKDEAEPAPSPLPTPFSINDLDLVFVMDTTGSMRNELADVQANLLGVIRVLARLAPSLRVGFVAFKDRGDAYLTLTFPLSPMTQGNVGQVVEFVGRMSADGGGDDPEPVDEALRVATAMAARRGAGPYPGGRRRAGEAVGPRPRARARRAVPALVGRPFAAAHGLGDLHRRDRRGAPVLRADRPGRRRRLQRLSGADHRERAVVGAERPRPAAFGSGRMTSFERGREAGR